MTESSLSINATLPLPPAFSRLCLCWVVTVVIRGGSPSVLVAATLPVCLLSDKMQQKGIAMPDTHHPPLFWRPPPIPASPAPSTRRMLKMQTSHAPSFQYPHVPLKPLENSQNNLEKHLLLWKSFKLELTLMLKIQVREASKTLLTKAEQLLGTDQQRF